MLVSRQSRNQKKSINKIVLPGVDLNSRTPKTWSRPSASVSSIIGAMPEEIQVDFALANRWAVQEELNRLAGEIHDGLAQHLSAICLQLAVAKELISSTGGNPLGNIQQAIELANLGLAETRRCAHNLRRGVVDEPGLREALQGLAERWTVPGRLRCDFRSENVPENRLPSRAKHQLLRIAQEAIHNAVRHASPTLIDVTLRWHAPNVVLQVKDNGRGISADRLEKCEGFGLQNIRKRAREIGARFEIRTAVGQGTSITVTVPTS
jgi:signal transduction histidine kinase